MKIFVSARPKSKQSFVKQLDPTHFVVSVTEEPRGQKANKAIIIALAKFLKIKRSEIVLLKGEKTKEKVFSVNLSPEQLLV